MAQREDGYNISDTGNWNVASDYSRLKIMKPLYQADEYSNLALFGVLNADDPVLGNLDVAKLGGFKRLISCLVLLINNTKFAVAKDKKTLEGYEKELKRIDRLIPQLYLTRTNAVRKTREIILKEEIYNKILQRVLELKALINVPLNKHDLIFTHKEDFDPKKYKSEIFDRATNLG